MLGSENLGLGSVPTAGANPSNSGPGGAVDSVTATTPAVVNNADPANPVINVAAATPQPVGAAAVGTSNDLAVGNHSHAVLVAADAAAMAAIVVTAMPDGTPCYVTSRDGIFRLVTSARTTNTWDTFASATAGRQWQRDGRVSLKNATQAVWAVNTTTGSDDAVGGLATPLRTMSELAWRLFAANLTASIAVTLTGSMVATDLPIFRFRCLPAATFTVTCVPVVIYTSAVGVATAAAAGPGIGDNNFTDPAVPTGSFTGAGALAASVIGTRTNGTAAYFWFAKDKGVTTARISKPSAALANGDTYTASTLPTVQVMRFAEQRYNAVVIQLANINSGPWTDSSLRFERCWFTTASALPGVTYSNCAFAATNTVNQAASVRGFLLTGGGMVRGTGGGNLAVGLGVVTTHITGPMTFQGACLLVQGGYCQIDVDQYFNDFTGAGGGAITSSYWGVVLWTAGGLVGSGNTNFLLYADRMSQIAYAAAIVVAGSSPSATPIHAAGSADIAVAGLPLLVNAQQNGVYLST